MGYLKMIELSILHLIIIIIASLGIGFVLCLLIHVIVFMEIEYREIKGGKKNDKE